MVFIFPALLPLLGFVGKTIAGGALAGLGSRLFGGGRGGGQPASSYGPMSGALTGATAKAAQMAAIARRKQAAAIKENRARFHRILRDIQKSRVAANKFWDTQGGTMRQQLADAFTARRAELGTDLGRRGLTNTTIRMAGERGLASDYDRRRMEGDESLAGQKFRASSALGQEGRNLQASVVNEPISDQSIFQMEMTPYLMAMQQQQAAADAAASERAGSRGMYGDIFKGLANIAGSYIQSGRPLPFGIGGGGGNTSGYASVYG